MNNFIGVNMNKKFLGIRIGTVVTAILCTIAAIAFWVLAKYNLEVSREATVVLSKSLFEV